eukprot:111831-Amorphochlora_amoeboformis.AAC.1
MNVLRTLGALVLISHHLALGCEKSFDKDNGDGHLIRKILKFRTGVPREIGEDKSYDLHETRDSEPRGAVSQGLVGLRGGGDNSEKSGFLILHFKAYFMISCSVPQRLEMHGVHARCDYRETEGRFGDGSSDASTLAAP